MVSSIFSSFGRANFFDLSSGSDKIILKSPDTLLVSIFNWAIKTSEGFVGNDSDPVGPWYEAALPKREAFCIRDVSHQCLGAEIIGLKKQNLNMFRKFVENISEGKDYCSYWEINRYNKPAPVDYRSDEDFWYNLNANFDIIDACYKLFQWTGDSTYIFDPAFDNFFRLTLNQYINRWQLQPEMILDRPPFMNLKPGTTRFRFARGIPSYDEAQDNMVMSSDLLGMIYNGFIKYSQILKLRKQDDLSEQYRSRAEKYADLIDSLWWDRSSGSYYSFYNSARKFYTGGAGKSEFLLWYGVISDPARIEKSLLDLSNSQVEVLSYLPMLFYRYGFNNEGYDFLGKIFTDRRRDYPEASSGAIEGIVRGMMGVEPLAAEGLIQTCPRLGKNTEWVSVENIPVFSGYISVRHFSGSKTTFSSRSGRNVTWRAIFPGSCSKIKVNGRTMHPERFSDSLRHTFSFADMEVRPGTQVTAEAVY